MGLSYVAAGVQQSGGSGDVSALLPAAVAAGDLIVVVCGMRDTGVVSAPAGWTIVVQENSGDTSVNLTTSIASGFIAWTVYDGTSGTPTFTRSGGTDSWYAKSIAFRPDTSGYVPKLRASSSATLSSANTNVPTGSLSVTAGDLLIYALASPRRNTVSNYSAVTETASWTEFIDLNTTVGSDVGIASAYATANLTGSTGTISADHVLSARHLGMAVAFYESANSISGATNRTLDGLTATGTAQAEIKAAGGATLEGLTVSATGEGLASSGGVTAATLDGLVSSGAAASTISAQSTRTLDGLTSSASGAVESYGYTFPWPDRALQGISASSQATSAVSGAATATLDGVTSTGAAVLVVSAASATTLDDLVSTGAASSTLSGASAVTLDGLTVSSSATSETGIYGSTSATLDGVTSSGAAGSTISGSGSVSLDGLTGSSTAGALAAGLLAASLDGLSASASAESAVVGSGSVALDGVTSAGEASSTVDAATTAFLDGLSAQVEAAVLAQSWLSGVLAGLTCQSTAIIDTMVGTPPFCVCFSHVRYTAAFSDAGYAVQFQGKSCHEC